MRYDVVIIPESFHKFGKHELEHVCVPLVIEDRSYDIAMEIFNGIDRVLRKNFNVKAEDLKGEECDALYRRYEIEREGKKGIVHLKLRKIEKECEPVSGNRCSVIEFERDIECIIREVENCLS
jgi:hypothetical protein